jgi:post-segregation antitoxin (ccd killing protein)
VIQSVEATSLARGRHPSVTGIKAVVQRYSVFRADRAPFPVGVLRDRVAAAWRLWHTSTDRIMQPHLPDAPVDWLAAEGDPAPAPRPTLAELVERERLDSASTLDVVSADTARPPTAPFDLARHHRRAAAAGTSASHRARSPPGPIACTRRPGPHPGRSAPLPAMAVPPDSLPVDVYSMRMARVNITVPDELLGRVKAAGLNVSRVATAALAEELDRCAKLAELDAYLAELDAEFGPITAEEQAAAREWADRVLPPAGPATDTVRRSRSA